jgi:hypothetical protein
MNLTSTHLVVTLGFRDLQRLGSPGDRGRATAVRGPRETTEKKTMETTSPHHLQRDGKY